MAGAVITAEDVVVKLVDDFKPFFEKETTRVAEQELVTKQARRRAAVYYESIFEYITANPGEVRALFKEMPGNGCVQVNKLFLASIIVMVLCIYEREAGRPITKMEVVSLGLPYSDARIPIRYRISSLWDIEDFMKRMIRTFDNLVVPPDIYAWAFFGDAIADKNDVALTFFNADKLQMHMNKTMEEYDLHFRHTLYRIETIEVLLDRYATFDAAAQERYRVFRNEYLSPNGPGQTDLDEMADFLLDEPLPPNRKILREHIDVMQDQLLGMSPGNLLELCRGIREFYSSAREHLWNFNEAIDPNLGQPEKEIHELFSQLIDEENEIFMAVEFLFKMTNFCYDDRHRYFGAGTEMLNKFKLWHRYTRPHQRGTDNRLVALRYDAPANISQMLSKTTPPINPITKVPIPVTKSLNLLGFRTGPAPTNPLEMAFLLATVFTGGVKLTDTYVRLLLDRCKNNMPFLMTALAHLPDHLIREWDKLHDLLRNRGKSRRMRLGERLSLVEDALEEEIAGLDEINTGC